MLRFCLNSRRSGKLFSALSAPLLDFIGRCTHQDAKLLSLDIDSGVARATELAVCSMVVRRNNFSGPREAASRVMALFVGRDVRCVSIELSEFLVARLAIPLLLLLLLLLLAGRISFLDFRK